MGAFGTLAAVYSTAAAEDAKGVREKETDSAAALGRFLGSVERRAFRIAQLALRHEDDALDAVQDAMLQLARAYARRPAEEWKPLFYRILENRIRDMQRRRTVRGRVMSWMPFARDDEEGEALDPIEAAESPEPPVPARLEIDETLGALEEALGRLPARQRQAFLLRNFEGMDVAETAQAMGCSEGSVKTHYFRALQTLRAQLGEYWS
jgi:RNA polymerase sigma-70 factor (ECF subfamily)